MTTNRDTQYASQICWKNQWISMVNWIALQINQGVRINFRNLIKKQMTHRLNPSPRFHKFHEGFEHALQISVQTFIFNTRFSISDF